MKTRTLGFRKTMAQYWMLYLMLVPGLLYLLLNNYIPMAGLIIAFKDINYRKGIFASDWIGLKNFEFLFRTKDALLITKNTLLYNAVFILVNTVLAVVIAILLNEISARRGRKLYQSAILLPFLMSWVIISYLCNAFLNPDSGFFNCTILRLLGQEPVMWYNESKHWPLILVFVNTWKNVGYLCVIYYSAVISIDTEMYEAAAIEGATVLQRIRYITLPMIAPVVTMMALMAIGKIFYADFGLFYQVPMDSGPLYSVTNVIDTYVYRGLMQLGDIGMSSAAGLYQSIVGFVLVVASNLVVRKLSPDSALF